MTAYIIFNVYDHSEFYLSKSYESTPSSISGEMYHFVQHGHLAVRQNAWHIIRCGHGYNIVGTPNRRIVSR